MTSEKVRGIDATTIMRMATAHLARYSASSAGLRTVLARKIRRWGDKMHAEPVDNSTLASLLDDVVGRLTRAGLLDDAAFARSRAQRLAEKGLPRSRIRWDLQHQGLGFDGIDEMIAVEEDTQARRFASRKRLGPFRTGPRAPYRDKDIRALIRAGFSPRKAIAIIEDRVDGEDSASTEDVFR